MVITTLKTENGIAIENEHLRLSIHLRNGRYEQSLSTKGGAVACRSEQMKERGAIIIPSYDAFRLVEQPPGVELIMRGADGPHQYTCTYTVPAADKWVHVLVQVEISGAIELEGIRSAYQIAEGAPEFVFAPYIRPFDDTVVGQSGFKSPALAWLAHDALLILLADTAHLNAARPPLPAYLDLDADLREPRIGVGLITQQPADAVYFRHREGDAVCLPSGSRFSYAFYLSLHSGVRAEDAPTLVSKLLWDILAKPYLARPLPQVVPLETYAQRGLHYALEALWTEFDLEGRRCGAIRSGLRFPNDVWFQNQHNALDSALALHFFGRLWNNRELSRKASCVKELLLSSPDNRGLFSTVFSRNIRFGVPRVQWTSSSHWMSPDIAEEFGSISGRALARLVDWDSVHHTVSCSTVAYSMLTWYQEVEADKRLLERVRAYGEYLLSIQQQSGAIPSWIHRETHEIDGLLKDSVDSSCSGMVLAELYRVTKDQRYVQAAVKVARFVLDNVRPEGRWQDYETIFDSLAKPVGYFDRHTRQYAQTAGGIYWSCELFRILYEATGEHSWLTEGIRTLDYLSLFQSVWAPYFLSMNCFGGFAVGNSHPGWNDARQQLFGRLMLRYWELTKETRFFTRGLAAIRATLPLMFLPENETVAPTTYADGEIGWSYENYSHRGQDGPAISSSYDWGLGNCMTSLGWVLHKYGTLVIDLETNEALGIDGLSVRSCTIKGGHINLELEDHMPHRGMMSIMVVGAKDMDVEVTINGLTFGKRQVRGGRARISGTIDGRG